MTNHFLSLPYVLQQQLDLLCGADRSVLYGELESYSRRERRLDDDNTRIEPFASFLSPSPIGRRIQPQGSRRSH